MIPFYDSIDPAALVPTASFTHVAGYGTGRYTWPDATFQRYSRYIKIAVFPGQPDQAKIARCLDVERFDATPLDAPGFIEARIGAGHDDALIYCSLSVVPAVLDACQHLESKPWAFWAAWWWQRPHPPTAAEVQAELRALYGVTLPPGRLRACQWQPGGPFDSDIWYGRDTFSRGHAA